MTSKPPTIPTPATSAARPSASPDVTDWLFAKLLTMFGRGWADLWTGIPPETVKADWRAALACYEPETVRLAFESMHRDARQFPPNLSEFAALCRQFRRVGAHVIAITDNRRDPPPAGFASLRAILAKAAPK